ncbi:MAG: hypothetical protein JST54_01520 [Deltaproteobacteria bacterium]|nr:hypothetical protein [Deltaproteobacteria bacterium]
MLLGLAACSVSPKSGNPNTSPTPDTHTYFPIVQGPHAQDCSTCHGGFTTFKEFSCFGCHGHEVQAATDQLHLSVQGYKYDSPSCYQCHPTGGPVQPPFDHAGITGSCATCHGPGASFAALASQSDGSLVTVDGGLSHQPVNVDCSNCHNTGSWHATGGPANLVADLTRNLTVDAGLPTFVGTSIASMMTQSETLPMPMNHLTTTVDGGVIAACSNCHAGFESTGSYYPGNFHDSLVSLGIAQPTTCNDCHAGTMPAGSDMAGLSSMPTGFVGPLATAPARNPPSGEMKHDAVAWSNGSPTTTALVTQDCGTCHVNDAVNGTLSWTTGFSDAGPVYHPALAAAGATEPGSCLDCHANSRPTQTLVSAGGACPAGANCQTASVPANVAFDHASVEALGDCQSCHVASQADWTSWAGGVFHAAGATTPSTCLPCHDGERPTSTASWTSTTYTASPFDYGTADGGYPHGDGLDCVTCHNGPGTGAWGGTQNWVGGTFDHDPAASVAATTCLVCHSDQRPASPVTFPDGGSFNHHTDGNGDCFACHQATVQAGHYVNYFNPATGTLPGGDWQGGVAYPGSVLAGSGSQSVTVALLTLRRSGTLNLVTGMTTTQVKLINEMLHTSAQVPSQLAPVPPDINCWACHTSVGTTVTQFAGGVFHAALADAGLPQPSSGCSDCHAQMRPEVSPGQPTGIVEEAGSDLQPMDHNALFATGQGLVVSDGGMLTSVAQMDCGDCHRAPFTMPGVSWAGGNFHGSIGNAKPGDCTVCHYPLMADASGAANVTRGTLFAMNHASTQLTFQDCQTCHGSALGHATQGTPAASEFADGGFHGSLTATTQPGKCNDCHLVSEPGTLTASATTYSFAQGGTSTNGAQWMNHTATGVSGVDCATCHAADAKVSGSAWSKQDTVHSKVANLTSCNTCHGQNASTPGTNNNMPSGLTNSTTVTTAASDSTTGVAAGTLDQISHADANVSSHSCNLCHTQAGPSTSSGIQGKEWAQAKFHANFTGSSTLTTDGVTGRCSNCHLNVKPGSSFSVDHSGYTSVAGTTDCSGCHTFPGTGTIASPNWLGATSGAPSCITTGGFAVSQPPATSATTEPAISGCVPHPSTASTSCTTCHGTGTPTQGAIGYDHASGSKPCSACHEAGSTLIGPSNWNGATSVSAGGGDTRPYTLPLSTNNQGSQGMGSRAYCDSNNCPDGTSHWFTTGTDCSTCHSAPSGVALAQTGTNYKTAWKFTHPSQNGSCTATCKVCHPGSCPN